MIGQGVVIAIGGNESKRGQRSSILASFVRRAGGPDARIIIIPSASEAPEARALRYDRLFRRLGAGAVLAVHAERGTVTPDERDAVRSATGIFVTGGDQVKLMEHLRDVRLVEPIRDAVRNGAVYAGTSAGASAVSGKMIAGREDGSVAIYEGLGLVPDVIVDQHFGERQRLPRLLSASRAVQLVGIGIDENTAVVWNGSNGEVTVEGVGQVTIVDRHKIHILKGR
ncbi:MAG TPA: cyanophycinase [Thermoanaerobaculia bacterium]|jgi:cyanophycinase